VKRKDTSDKAVEDVPSDAGSQQQLIFDNKAYQNEPTPSLSGSELDLILKFFILIGVISLLTYKMVPVLQKRNRKGMEFEHNL
jgi:hypothetical protein